MRALRKQGFGAMVQFLKGFRQIFTDFVAFCLEKQSNFDETGQFLIFLRESNGTVS